MLHETLQVVHSSRKASTCSLPPEDTRPPGGLKQSQSTICFVAVQKLRESKWFAPEEHKVLCSVVETGFILERRVHPADLDTKWAVALWKPGHERSKDLRHLSVCWARPDAAKLRVHTLSLADWWTPESCIRINNKQDKTCVANSEEDIRKQTQTGGKAKSMTWHNSQHFAYWCRYERPGARARQSSALPRWASSVSTLFTLRTRSRTHADTN